MANQEQNTYRHDNQSQKQQHGHEGAKRGFAAMDQAEQREVAAEGGRSSREQQASPTQYAADRKQQGRERSDEQTSSRSTSSKSNDKDYEDLEERTDSSSRSCQTERDNSKSNSKSRH